ncbi:hypothetical protein [Pedobacter sp. ASV12]|uniref:hypothetical protein n=1 Tax=Pedobacter sp. ASV12 TaxID=2795120 RepID=UPI0018EE206B|nr:hypothetical protein [Pedobacter sp. ASV12]
MKHRLLSLAAVLILSSTIPNLWAQAPATAQQAPAKTQATAAKTPLQTTKPAPSYTRIDTAKNTDPSLHGQYQFMLSRSKSLNGYKLINPYRLSTLWQSVSDTLRKERVELNKAKSKIAEQAKTINSLQTDINGKETSLNNADAKVNEINFLGISFTKSTYNIIVWSIIAILAIALFVVIARSTKNILEAKHRTQLYDEVSAEYQAYKAKASEKERKLARELQDERNAMEELKSRGKL